MHSHVVKYRICHYLHRYKARYADNVDNTYPMTAHQYARNVIMQCCVCTPGPILSVFSALIVHSELKKEVCTPDFQWHLFFKHK